MIVPLEHWKVLGIKVVSTLTPSVDPLEEALKSLERVALDLHVGSAYDTDFTRWIAIKDGINLEPGQCIRVEVDEKIETPDNVFGQVCSKTSQTADGLFAANLKVDPNFQGQITPTLFNAGKKPVRITQGLLFASVWFGTIDPVPVKPPRRDAHQKRTVELARRGPRETLVAVRPYLLTGIATIVTALVPALLLKLI
jgi:deoxycytidine triphosphate deaminase